MENISNTTNLNVRVDSNLKKESDMLFKDLGLNTTTAINMFLTKCVKTASIPFEISNPKPNKEMRKALKEAQDIIDGKVQAKGYRNMDELFEDLDKDD